MATVVAGSVLVAWLLGAALVVRALHLRAWNIESADLDTAEQVYRLHRLVLIGVGVTGGYAVLGLAAFVTTSIAVDGGDATHWIAVATALVGVPLCVVPMIAAVRVIRRSYARVRGVSIRAHGRRYIHLLSFGSALVVVIGIGAGRAVFPRHGFGHVAGMLLVYLVVLVAVQVLIAPLTIVALHARPLPDETRLRLRRLATRMGVRVRDIRAIPGRAQRVANAAQIGAIPGLRYIVVTDYLLDQLPDDEIDAVVAHELGHVRGHHLTLKLASVFATWAVLEAAFVTVSALTGASTLLLLVPVVIAFPVGLVLVQGLVGVRLEQRADDAAASAVGSARLASALESIARLNHLKPDTGRMWAVLTQHPGVDDRLSRLHARVPATTERAIAAR